MVLIEKHKGSALSQDTTKMVEPASTLLSHRLPEIHHIRGTEYPSVNTERLSEHLMHPWHSFQDDIFAAYNTLDLSGLVSII